MKTKLNKLSSYGCLLLEYREIILGLLTGEMDLQTYILILGKTYLWTCRCKETKQSFSHIERILLNKYQTEKYSSFKWNNISLFQKKWRIFEEMIALIVVFKMLRFLPCLPLNSSSCSQSMIVEINSNNNKKRI